MWVNGVITLLPVVSPNTDCQNSFTCRLGSRFVTRSSIKTSRHFQHVLWNTSHLHDSQQPMAWFRMSAFNSFLTFIQAMHVTIYKQYLQTWEISHRYMMITSHPSLTKHGKFLLFCKQVHVMPILVVVYYFFKHQFCTVIINDHKRHLSINTTQCCCYPPA